MILDKINNKILILVFGLFVISFFIITTTFFYMGYNNVIGVDKNVFQPYLRYIQPKRVQQEIRIKTEKIVREIIVRELQTDLEAIKVAAKKEESIPGLTIVNPKSKTSVKQNQEATNGKNIN